MCTMATRLKELSQMKKLYIALAVIVCILVFYAIGNAANLFSSFSEVSNQTADNIAYAAIAVAVALTALDLSLTIINKRKPKHQTRNKPNIPTILPLNLASTRFSQEKSSGKIPSFPKITKNEQGNAPTKYSSVQASKQSSTQTLTNPYIEDDKLTNQQPEIKENTNKITCPACKREFSTPLLMVDYSEGKPKLVRHCPYCDQPLDKVQEENSEEAIWNKYLKPS